MPRQCETRTLRIQLKALVACIRVQKKLHGESRVTQTPNRGAAGRSGCKSGSRIPATEIRHRRRARARVACACARARACAQGERGARTETMKSRAR